jgi:hypothetical protein
LAFGSRVLATSTTIKATLKNNLSVALNITSIAASGDFAQTNTCGTSLAAGASCTISVTFTPTATGSRTGTLTVSDDASNSPQSVSLTGAGILPITVSAATLSVR